MASPMPITDSCLGHVPGIHTEVPSVVPPVRAILDRRDKPGGEPIKEAKPVHAVPNCEILHDS